jgi:hypothetical protein
VGQFFSPFSAKDFAFFNFCSGQLFSFELTG